MLEKFLHKILSTKGNPAQPKMRKNIKPQENVQL